MEHCSKCGKAMPKIFGIYWDNHYKEGDKITCEACHLKELAKIGEIINKNTKLRESTPNNGCVNCGSQNATYFDVENVSWLCENCYLIAQYGEEKAQEILERKKEANNIKYFGDLKLYIKEREFEIIPRYGKHRVDDVISYELIENGSVETKGGIGGAIIGSAIAGVPGALIGYDKGKKRKNVCSEYRILIRMKGKAPVEIGYIGGGCNVSYDSAEFLGYKKSASNTISGIEYILEMIEKQRTEKSQETSDVSKSFADEVVKLKKLLDEGLITTAEFEKAKEKLLNK